MLTFFCHCHLPSVIPASARESRVSTITLLCRLRSLMQTYLFYRSVIQTVVFTFNTLDPQVKPEDDIVSIVILTPYQVRGKLQ